MAYTASYTPLSDFINKLTTTLETYQHSVKTRFGNLDEQYPGAEKILSNLQKLVQSLPSKYDESIDSKLEKGCELQSQFLVSFTHLADNHNEIIKITNNLIGTLNKQFNDSGVPQSIAEELFRRINPTTKKLKELEATYNKLKRHSKELRLEKWSKGRGATSAAAAAAAVPSYNLPEIYELSW